MTKPEHTQFIGRHILEFEHLGSTNEYIKKKLKSRTVPEGTIVITQNQYAGKGQQSNKWESEAGKNLTFSMVLYPLFLPVNRHFLLNQSVALGVVDALQQFIPTGLTTKWPNDIYILNKKVGGILIQNSLQGKTIQCSVVGIGINVNQSTFNSDASNPVSMLQAAGRTFNLEAVFHQICQCLEFRYLQLKNGQFVRLQQDYQKNLLRYQQTGMYRDKESGEVFSALLKGVASDGKLQLQDGKRLREYAFKEVTFLFE